MSLLGIFSILSTGARAIKEAKTPTIPAENWANKELYYKDMMEGVSPEQRMKNLENGKYKVAEKKHPEPHRDENGKVVIENCELFNEDVRKHGAYQAYKWADQGKYNLTPEELEKKNEEHKARMEYLYSLVGGTQRGQLENQEKKSIEQELAEARQAMANECRKILANANYSNVDFSLKHRSGITNEPYGYNVGQITAQKDDEKYSVGFEVIPSANIPEANGNALLKSLATIMANVDMSDLENRNSLLKEALKSEENLLLNESEDFTLVNDTLSISVTVCALDVSLRFYTSKIKKQILPLSFDTMNGHEFEFFCASLLKKNGYDRINVTRGSGDQGIDIIAYRDGIKYGIQCKCYSGDIGNKAVQEVFAGKTFYECHVGVVLTNQYFTKSAIELAKKNGIILWDRKKLMELVEKANNSEPEC